MIWDFWNIAMVCILPFIIAECFFKSHRFTPVKKLRTWASVMGAALIGYYLHNNFNYVGAYMVVDALAALIVYARPNSAAQKSISFLFLIMVITHIFYGLFEMDTMLYNELMGKFGYLILMILAVWSIKDAGKAIHNRFWNNKHSSNNLSTSKAC